MNLQECYKQMDGDYEGMFSRLPRETSIIKYLRRFAENDEFDKLKGAVEAKDYKAVFELTHDLKGMAANLSLPVFQEMMSEMCEETRDKEPEKDLTVLIKTAGEEHEKILKAIGELEDA